MFPWGVRYSPIPITSENKEIFGINGIIVHNREKKNININIWFKFVGKDWLMEIKKNVFFANIDLWVKIVSWHLKQKF